MAVDYSYSSDFTNMGGLMGFFGAIFFAVFIVAMALSVFMIIVMWKIYKKAGKEGWEAIVPIYNIIVLFQIIGVNPLWIIAFFIPFVNFVASIAFAIILPFKLASVFGKSPGFGFGLLFLPIVFMPLLAFGDAEYYSNTYETVAEPMMAQTPVVAEPVVNQPQPEVMAQPVVNTVDPTTFASVVPITPVQPVQPVQPVEPVVNATPEPVQPTDQNNI